MWLGPHFRVAATGIRSLAAQVEGWIIQGEHQELEYKQELGDDKTKRRFADTVAAFANGTGGVVLVGVADDSTLIGWDPPKASDRIADILRNLVADSVAVRVERVVVRGKVIHAVVVPPADSSAKPYRSAGRIMVRVLGTTTEATTTEIRRMAAEVEARRSFRSLWP